MQLHLGFAQEHRSGTVAFICCTITRSSRKQAARHRPPAWLWCSGSALWQSGFSRSSLKLLNDHMLSHLKRERGSVLWLFCVSSILLYIIFASLPGLWLGFFLFWFCSQTLVVRTPDIFFSQLWRFWNSSCLLCSVIYFTLATNTHLSDSSGSSGLVSLLGAEWEHFWNR